MTVKPKNYLLGVFDDEEIMMHAGHAVVDQKITIDDIYTPFPVHGLDDLLEIKRSGLPYVTFAAGSTGLALSLYFQYWTSVTDWPLIVGGKPFNSFTAFIPVAFEITVLFGALFTVAAFFYRCKLFPWTRAKVIHPTVTDHSFVIAIECSNSSIDTEFVEQILIDHGAVEVIREGVLA